MMRSIKCRYMITTLVSSTLVTFAALFPGISFADTEVASVERPTPISAYNGRLAWSEYISSLDKYRLMTRYKGSTSLLDIKSRGVPFDVDLGPDKNGKTVATYSRCKTEPKGNSLGLVDWVSGKDCDIYIYSFSSKNEKKQKKVNTSSGSEFLPSIWKKNIAFARKVSGEPTLMLVRNLQSDQQSKRIARGTLQICIDKSSGRKCFDVDDPMPGSIDIYGSNVGFAWQYEGDGEGTTYEVVLSPIEGNRKILETGKTGQSADIFLNPTFVEGYLYFAETCGGDSSGCSGREQYHQYRLKNGKQKDVSAPKKLLGFTRDSSNTYYLQSVDRLLGGSGRTCQKDSTKETTKCPINKEKPNPF